MASQLLVSTPYSASLFVSTLFYWSYCPFPLSSNETIAAWNNRLGDTCCDMACYIYIFISGTVQDILMKFCTHIQTTKTGHTAKFCDCVINELFFSFFFFLHFTGGTSGDDPYFVSNQNCQKSAIWAFCLCTTGEFLWEYWRVLLLQIFFVCFVFMDSIEFTGDIKQFPQYL